MPASCDYTFVSYAGLNGLDIDDQVVANWLTERGVKVNCAVWDDPKVDWANAGVCILRSCWDYHLKPEAFLAWVKRVSSLTTLLNPFSLVSWNADKSYLLDLERKGISIIPTSMVSSSAEVDAVMASRTDSDFIVKPSIGLCTHGVARFRGANARAEAAAHAKTLLTTGVPNTVFGEKGLSVPAAKVLIQPYLAAVETTGERALVFIEGEFSHAIQKSPFQALAPTGQAGERFIEAEPQEIDLGYKALATLPERPLYARVDMVADDSGHPCIMELELIEPSLYCTLYPPAIERLGKVLLASLMPAMR